MTIAALEDRDDAIIYSAGICACSVCAPSGMSRDELERQVNAQLPTGLSHGWQISEAATFASGEQNPCACPDAPGRMHYLLNC